MNILMVLSTKKYPPDGRVEREARDLIRDGHNLFLIARRGLGQKAQEDVENVHVIRTPLPFQRRKAVSDLLYFFCQRYVIIFHIIGVCIRHRIDALHVHDLPYALATAAAGKILGIPVIFDMHEHYTIMLKMSFEARTYRKFKVFSFILLGLLRLEEKFACRLSQKVIVVAEEHIPRIHGLGTPYEKIIVVTNTEDIDSFINIPLDESLSGKYSDDFIILYLGAFSPHRGLETAVQAMPAVLQTIPNARLLLVGDGCNINELRELTQRMGLNDRVTFTGYQPAHTLPTYIRLSDVGLIPHISTPHIETTMPNKIFQFMILGKPVIVSSTRPMMRVVNDTRCGLIFQERDPHSLAKIIVQLQDKSLRFRLGNNGRDAVENRYNWQVTVQSLLKLYHKQL